MSEGERERGREREWERGRKREWGVVPVVAVRVKGVGARERGREGERERERVGSGTCCGGESEGGAASAATQREHVDLVHGAGLHAW